MTLYESKVSRRASLAIVPLTVLLLSNVGHANSPTAITTCGFEIRTPGQYYLANDLLGCPGIGIYILTSNVQLRLDGHTIQGLGSGLPGSGNGIAARFGDGQTAILIQGPGTITGFNVGLWFDNVAFSNVSGVTATGNQVGFLLTHFSNQNMIQDNVATENDFNGIDITASSENKVVNNLVTNNRILGILLSGGAHLNDLHANTVTGNLDTGILVGLGSTQNNIAGNTALGGDRFDVVDNNPDCDDNRWQGNRFVTAFPSSCIQ